MSCKSKIFWNKWLRKKCFCWGQSNKITFGQFFNQSCQSSPDLDDQRIVIRRRITSDEEINFFHQLPQRSPEKWVTLKHQQIGPAPGIDWMHNLKQKQSHLWIYNCRMTVAFTRKSLLAFPDLEQMESSSSCRRWGCPGVGQNLLQTGNKKNKTLNITIN